MVSTVAIDLEEVRAILQDVVDPEIPVLTIEDLGILRRIEEEKGEVVVVITPTYSGCPAMRQIEDDIGSVLTGQGYDFSVRVEHNPPWSTSWISEEGNRKLASFGIAPPTALSEAICPQCGAGDLRMVNLFGSTACKALMTCRSCGEPFDYFKRF